MSGRPSGILGARPVNTYGRVLKALLQAFGPAVLVFVIIGGLSAAEDKAFADSQKAAQGGNGELQFLRQDGSTEVSITIEIADTPEARIRGLMERWSLPELHGMLLFLITRRCRGSGCTTRPSRLT